MLVPLALAALLIASLHSAQPQTRPSPTPPAMSTPQPAPSVSPRPGQETPAPDPTPLALPPDAQPQIVDIRINSTVFRSEDTVSGTVITSTNVASVELRLAGYSLPVPRIDYGVFALTSQIGKIPFFARHAYTLQVIARNARGNQVERDLQITLR